MAFTPFIVDRKIDYTVTQRFAVVAPDADAAVEILDQFVSESAQATPASPRQVVQLEDRMDQIENTCAFEVRVDTGAHELAVGPTLLESLARDRATNMLGLLRRISNFAAPSHLLREVDELLADLDAEVEANRAGLAAMTGSQA